MLERRHNPSKNKALPLTCCLMGVIIFFEQKLMEEKQKKRLEQASQSRSTKTTIDPPSPIKRQGKWKMDCIKKSS